MNLKKELKEARELGLSPYEARVIGTCIRTLIRELNRHKNNKCSCKNIPRQFRKDYKLFCKLRQNEIEYKLKSDIPDIIKVYSFQKRLRNETKKI